MSRSFPVAAAIVLLGFATPPTPAADEDSNLAFEERLLKEAGYLSDGPGLLAFLHSQVLSDKDLDRLTASVRDLGDERFAVRERASQVLRKAGRSALALLKPALTSSDPEVARRAQTALDEIDQASASAVLAAAARLTAVRQPAGAAEALLACVPLAVDEEAEEALIAALAAVGLKNGAVEPPLVAAAADREPTRRAAAGFVLGQGNAEDKRRALPLLEDKDPLVRYRTALGLVRSGDRAGVPALLALLGDGPESLAWRAEDVFSRLAGENAPGEAVGLPDPQARKKCRQAWEAWWKTNGDKADLARVGREEEELGLTVITELSSTNAAGGGRVWECGRDGKQRWEITNLQQPIDARVLPGGHILIAEHGGMKVTERDRKGTVLWEQRTEHNPVSCQRLPNGNTVIVTYGKIFEVTRDHKVVFEKTAEGGMLTNGVKNRNVYTYFAGPNRAMEVDAAGKVLNTITAPGANGWGCVERITGGRYLMTGGSNNVYEMDASGKVLRKIDLKDRPSHVTRVRNGNLLIAFMEAGYVAEFSPDGKEVWRARTSGRTFHAWRR
jgi:HEAT repeat protein